jgi:hypothetical protein
MKVPVNTVTLAIAPHTNRSDWLIAAVPDE